MGAHTALPANTLKSSRSKLVVDFRKTQCKITSFLLPLFFCLEQNNNNTNVIVACYIQKQNHKKTALKHLGPTPNNTPLGYRHICMSQWAGEQGAIGLWTRIVVDQLLPALPSHIILLMLLLQNLPYCV